MKSFVEMNSEVLSFMCDKAIENFEEERKNRAENLLKVIIKYKNSGLSGWFRKMFKVQYDRERAIKYCRRKYSYDYVRKEKYSGQELGIGILATMAKYNDKVCVIAEDLETLYFWLLCSKDRGEK